jgi:DNA-binding transcriptional LysR family regulator
MTENQIRYLSFDDLLILSYLGSGVTSVTEVAKSLCLTQPAITRRIRKMEQVLQGKIVQRVNRGVKMTDLGHTTAIRAQKAIEAMILEAS